MKWRRIDNGELIKTGDMIWHHDKEFNPEEAIKTCCNTEDKWIQRNYVSPRGHYRLVEEEIEIREETNDRKLDPEL